jgi:prepilin-type N-terminal cleavage/methylation domain-containing protein
MRSERGYTLIEMMMVVGIIGVIAATVIPITDMSIRGSRLRGDAQIIRNLVGVAKMRASAQFTRARVMANLGNPQANPPVPGSFVLQVWNKPANGNPGAWVNDGGVNQLSPGVSFGFAELNAPPPNTQVNIMQSPTCTNTLTVADPIANTACVTFN